MTRPARRWGPLVTGVVSLALTACAAVPPRPAGPMAPATAEGEAARHREAGAVLEREGRLRRALEEWTVVLTLKPDDAGARAEKKKLEGRIEQAVADRIRQGREALGRGAYPEARRHFLAALALDPASRTAFEALQTEIKETRIVTHTVRRGETLALIAERYYGDRSRWELIADANQLPRNARLVIGVTLKIPEIPAVPSAAPSVVPDARARDEVADPNPLMIEAREALDNADYAVALVAVDKVVAASPRNPEALDLKKTILYQLGRSQFAQKRYDESYQTLTQLAALAPNYQDLARLMREIRTSLVQRHYSEGLRLFQEEQLEEAIAQWRLVLEHDPEHAGARRNIQQAERLLKGLEQRRKK